MSEIKWLWITCIVIAVLYMILEVVSGKSSDAVEVYIAASFVLVGIGKILDRLPK